MQEVLNSYQNDPEASAMLQDLAVISPNNVGYTLTEGIIRHKDRIWIGSNSALQTKLISTFHASALGGHSGIQVTYQRLKKVLILRIHMAGHETGCGVICQTVWDLSVG
jgi:hypothetical protein